MLLWLTVLTVADVAGFLVLLILFAGVARWLKEAEERQRFIMDLLTAGAERSSVPAEKEE